MSRSSPAAENKLASMARRGPKGENRLARMATDAAGSGFMRGLTALPYRLLGAPVDLADMVVRPIANAAGIPIAEPENMYGTSDWMIKHAVNNGLLMPRTGSGAEMGGDFLGQIAAPGVGPGEAAAAKAIFAGPLALTADLEAMRRAQSRLEAGDDPAKVWADEGWFRGPDGKMRFEIDDSGATVHWSGLSKIDPDVEDLHRYGSVESSVNHPALTSAYPDVDSIPVIAYESMAGLRGSYHHQPWEQIDLSGFAGDSMRSRLLDSRRALEPYANDPDPILAEAASEKLAEIENMLSRGIYGPREREAMIHELQHAVQTREGFSMGANAEAAGNDAYRRALGEVEARATQRRRDMTAEQRRARYPLQDYDVPLNELIIR